MMAAFVRKPVKAAIPFVEPGHLKGRTKQPCFSQQFVHKRLSPSTAARLSDRRPSNT
jgi:hypothetical protein